jgi:hypothetical protein
MQRIGGDATSSEKGNGFEAGFRSAADSAFGSDERVAQGNNPLQGHQVSHDLVSGVEAGSGDPSLQQESGPAWGDGSVGGSVSAQGPGPITPALSVALTDSEDAAIWSRFIQDYLALLNQRVDTIRQHLSNGNDVGARTALMSLASTSSMLGASELVEVVNRLQTAVDQRLGHELPQLADSLVKEAAALRLRLAGEGSSEVGG